MYVASIPPRLHLCGMRLGPSSGAWLGSWSEEMENVAAVGGKGHLKRGTLPRGVWAGEGLFPAGRTQVSKV